MPNAIPDLWPEIQQSEVVPPLAILREQAVALGKKTGQLLEGRVSTRTDADGNLVHSFSVVAPSLDNYSYRLFSLYHGADPYPVTVPECLALEAPPHAAPVPGSLAERRIGSETELLRYLREILNSEKTKRIVGSLLAQVKAAT
jgi:hypothetical protein